MSRNKINRLCNKGNITCNVRKHSKSSQSAQSVLEANCKPKTPFFDDASKVRLFKIESSNPLRYTDKGTFDTLLLLRNPEKYNL